MNKFNIKDKVVVITGGAGVLFSTIATHLAKLGAKVIILDIAEDKIKIKQNELQKIDSRARGYCTNVLDKKSLIKVKEKILDQFGRIDILINGAGGNKEKATTGDSKEFFHLEQNAIEDVMSLNFMGTVLPSQVFGEVMKKQNKGIIINVSSMAAVKPLTKTIAYSAAKSAVSNFTEWLAVHMNQNYSKNIRVNAIAPGFLLTDQNKYLLIDEETGDETPRGKKIKENTPMDRYGEPEELVGAIIWLSSEASSFVNGIILPIDGGFAAYSGV